MRRISSKSHSSKLMMYLKDKRRKYCAFMFKVSYEMCEFFSDAKKRYADCGLNDEKKYEIELDVNLTWQVGKNALENREKLEEVVEEIELQESRYLEEIDTLKGGIEELYALYCDDKYEQMQSVFDRYISKRYIDNLDK